MLVLDATPLIYLAKAGLLADLRELSADRVVPRRVYDEVVGRGLEEGYPDARAVERADEEGVFEIEQAPPSSLFERLRRNENASAADAAVLALADERAGVAVIDEAYGRLVADAEGIPTRGTASLVLGLLSIGVLEPAEARGAIDAMVEAGWFCGTDLYAALLAKIDELS